MGNNFKEYLSILNDNFSIFVKNFSSNYLPSFGIIISSLESIWQRLGKERDLCGHSHVGILPFVNLLIRHSIFGFQHIAYYQSFLCWLTFRPGLEAFLILGKFVDDPANANIWKNRETDREAYIRTFQGRNLASNCLPQSTEFQKILSRLNDQFMHPNPDFVYRDTKLLDGGDSSLFLRTEYFDSAKEPGIHESHLLAYLNLLDKISFGSNKLVNQLCGPAPKELRPAKSFDESSEEKAVHLAESSPLCKKIMKELGLWIF